MIRTSFTEDADGCIVFTVKGHAGMARKGEDILCAAASALTYTIAQNTEDLHRNGMLRKKPKISLKSGDAVITAKPLKAYRTEAWHAFFVVQRGFEVLAANYPDRISVQTFGSTVA